MTEHTDLDAILARAAAAGLSARPTMPCTSPEDALWFIADAVQTTVLPRALQVYVDDAACFTMHASGGRALEVTDSRVAEMRPGALSVDDLPDFARALQTLVATATTVAVQPNPTDADPGASLHGIPGAMLIEHLGCALPACPVPERWITLVAAAQEVTLATWHYPDAPQIVSEGFTLSEASRSWLGSVLEASDHALSVEHLQLIHDACSSDITMCVHHFESTKAALLIRRDAAMDVAAFWASLGR